MTIHRSFHHTRSRLLILFGFLFSLFLPIPTRAQSTQVQVLLFYSPFCGHCQKLISEDLPPIVQAYNTDYVWTYFGDPPDEETGQLPPIVAFEGNVLQILYVDTSTEVGAELYRANVDRFQIPPADQVVPIMVVGEQLLIGGTDIPQQLPGLIDSWLAEGGLAWPDVPGLDAVVSALVPFPGTEQESPTPDTNGAQAEPTAASPDSTVTNQTGQNPSFDLHTSNLSVVERIKLDPLGNSLSIVVLIGMLFSLVATAFRWRLVGSGRENRGSSTTILVLILFGVAVAGYLSFTATSGTEAVCGPVGDCHTVQSSKYSHLFGLIPNGLLGLIAYLGMLLAWAVARQPQRLSMYADLALFGLALFGTVFSAYLTFLEPFVIGATCMWCLSSAVVITLIMLLSLERARAAYDHLRA